jgi:hypothetical protein
VRLSSRLRRGREKLNFQTRVKLHGQRIRLGEVESHMQKNLPESMAVGADVITTTQNRSYLAGSIFSWTDMGKSSDTEDGLLPKSVARPSLTCCQT